MDINLTNPNKTSTAVILQTLQNKKGKKFAMEYILKNKKMKDKCCCEDK